MGETRIDLFNPTPKDRAAPIGPPMRIRPAGLSIEQQVRAAALKFSTTFHAGRVVSDSDVLDTADTFAEYITSGRI